MSERWESESNGEERERREREREEREKTFLQSRSSNVYMVPCFGIKFDVYRSISATNQPMVDVFPSLHSTPTHSLVRSLRRGKRAGRTVGLSEC